MQQTISRPGPQLNSPNHKDGNTRSQTIIITAISFFALAGLLAGFAVGALNRPTRATQPTPTVTMLPTVTPKASPTPRYETQPRPLGFPVITEYTATQIADGATSYTVAAHPVDQSIDKGHGKAIQASNITCKIWLTKDKKVTDTLLKNASRLKNVDTLSQPMPNEEVNAFTFIEGQQTQTCKATGDTIWKYQVSPSLKKGSYTLVVLMDWAGQRYNWSFVYVIITNNS